MRCKNSTKNTSDDMPDKRAIRAAKILMQMAERKRTFHSFETSDHHKLAGNLEKGMVPSTKRPKQQQSTCIAPTVTATFSFSIIQLLCAVRYALITPLTPSKYADKHGGCSSGSEGFPQRHLPSLTTHEIVECVRLNPKDFRILEAKEPLQDLVAGVLKVFSSITIPVGAKARTTLVVYERHCKSWSWIGPLPSFSQHSKETSAEAWGVPWRTLVELVDSFADWLKEGQEMLRKISCLPKPPHEVMQCVNFGDRLKESRTISPCCEEIRACFRREEYLRYTVPGRAFKYTAVDRRKSAVAPLKRCRGKPSIKVRDHHILKPNRPPHFTVLCLVRDAAARLPGGVGTRADICVLVRDSQFVVEDSSDSQVNKVVGGALDRLHYENDPCVKYEKRWHRWAYLHGDRQEEDFEYDSTYSQKSRKKAKKDGH